MITPIPAISADLSLRSSYLFCFNLTIAFGFRAAVSPTNNRNTNSRSQADNPSTRSFLNRT